jgi:hypothetical protein
MCELVNDAALLFDLENPDWDYLSRALSDACEAAEIESIEYLSFESTELEVGLNRFPAYTAKVQPQDGESCHLGFSTVEGELYMFVLTNSLPAAGDREQ